MSRVAPKLPKALAEALYKHRIDAKKYPSKDIMKKFGIKSHNDFYRMMYHAVMQLS